MTAIITKGAPTVTINGLPVARVSDTTNGETESDVSSAVSGGLSQAFGAMPSGLSWGNTQLNVVNGVFQMTSSLILPGTGNTQAATIQDIDNAISNSGGVTYPITITQGGTGANTSASARSNLGLANVANTGLYSDLSGTPDLSGFVSNTQLAANLANYTLTANLANVAISGSYNDLANTPTVQGVSVKEFGCKCDGSTDDTVDFQTALNSGYPHIIVEGTMNISNTIILPNNTIITILPSAMVQWKGGANNVFETNANTCCHDLVLNCYGLVDISNAAIGIYLHSHKNCKISWSSQANNDSGLLVFKSVSDSTGSGAIYEGNRGTSDNIYPWIYHHGQIGGLIYIAGADANDPNTGDLVAPNTISDFGKIRTIGNNSDSTAGIYNIGIEFGPHTDTNIFRDMVSLDLLSGSTGIKIDDNANGDCYSIYFYGEVNVSFYGTVATNRTGIYVGAGSRWIWIPNFYVDGTTTANAEIDAGAVVINANAVAYDITFSSEGGEYANKAIRRCSDVVTFMSTSNSGYGRYDILNLTDSNVNIFDDISANGYYGGNYYGFVTGTNGHSNGSGGFYPIYTRFVHGVSGGMMLTNEIVNFDGSNTTWTVNDTYYPAFAFIQHIGNKDWEWRYTAAGSNTQTTVATLDGSGNMTLNGIISANNITSDPKISGAKLSFVSNTSIQCGTGILYVQNGACVLISSNLTANISPSASTWYHAYVSNSSSPTLTLETTAPAAPYMGTARSKTGDTSKRYIGSALTDANSHFYNFTHFPETGYINWVTNPSNSPFRVVSGGTSTTSNTVSCSNAIPVTSQMFFARLLNLSNNSQVYLNTPDMGSVSPTNYIQTAKQGQDMTSLVLTNSSQNINYIFIFAPTGGGLNLDINGYYFER